MSLLQSRLLLAWIAGCTACSPFDKFDDYRVVVSDASVAPAVRCDSLQIPNRPRVPGGLGTLAFSVATRPVDFGDSPNSPIDYRDLGYDLDRICTHDAESGSCIPPAWAMPAANDGSRGRDNALGALLHETTQLAGTTASQASNSSTQQGALTTVIHVRGYNGGSVDDTVEVGIVAASMFDLAQSAGPAPQWNGHDEWHALDTWLDGKAKADDEADPSERFKYVDTRAYVTDGTLVAQFPELLLTTGVMRWAVLTAKLEQRTPDRWVLSEGVLAGRHRVDELLALFAFVKDASGTVCLDSVNYPLWKARLCSYVDLAADGSNDRSSECDAVSWAWSFSTEPVILRGVVETERLRSALPSCPPGNTPANDHCNTLGPNLVATH